MSRRGEVLIVTVNNRQDFEIVCNQSWYRIPIESVEKYLKPYWSPEWLAFYQTKVFVEEAYQIKYYAKVLQIQRVDRSHLFPQELPSEKSHRLYYQLSLANLEQLTLPIVNADKRRFTFIPTTLNQLGRAVEIGELYGN